MRPRCRAGGCGAAHLLVLLCLAAAALRLAGAHVCEHDALPVHSGVAAGERHPQQYEALPFAASLSSEKSAAAEGGPDAAAGTQPRRAARLLAQTARMTQPYAGLDRAQAAPLRFALEWRGDAGSGAAAAVPPLVQAWVRHALVPIAAAWWSAALKVWPVRGNLTLSQPVPCSSVPSDALMTGPWADADVALRVYIAPSRNSAPPPLATPDACSAAASRCSVAMTACADTTRACVVAGNNPSSSACTTAVAACTESSLQCGLAAATCEAARRGKPPVLVSTVAFASTCALDQYDRPTAGVLTYVPSTLSGNAEVLAAATAWAGTAFGIAALAQPNASAAALTPQQARAKLKVMMLPDAAGKQLLYVTMHEMGHALGFSANLMPLFRDGATGEPRAERLGVRDINGVIDLAYGAPTNGLMLPATMLATPAERGHLNCGNTSRLTPGCVYKLLTPAAVAAAARHFACPAAMLLGPELENEEVESAMGTASARARWAYGSHWEQRLFASELMAPVLQYDEMFVSEVTLAFFEDSGWYYPDYAQALATTALPGVRWGMGQGCDFALRECLQQRSNPNAAVDLAAAALEDGTVQNAALASAMQPAGSPPHFCSVPHAAQCTYDLSYKGVCDVVALDSADLANTPYYAYFSTLPVPTALKYVENYGGTLRHNDFCPTVAPIQSCRADPGDLGMNAAGEWFSSLSLCVMSTLAPPTRVNGTGGAARPVPLPGCYGAMCTPDGLSVALFARSLNGELQHVVCLAAQEGMALPVPGFAGALVCPPAWVVCGRRPEPCAATAESYGLSGTTLALGLAAAGAAAVAVLLYTPVRLAAVWQNGAPARQEAREEAVARASAAAAAVEAEAEVMRTALAFRGGDGREMAQLAPPPPPPRAWGEDNPFGADDGADGDAARPQPPPPPHAPRFQPFGRSEASAFEADDAAAEPLPHPHPSHDREASSPPSQPQPPPPMPLLARAAALRAPGCFPLLAQDVPGPREVLLLSHPASVLLRSVAYALSRGARHLQPGAPVQAHMYEQTRGWGAAAITLRLVETAAGGGARPLPPPQELPPGAGWAPQLGRKRHPASFTVSRVGADSRGAPLYALRAYDFDAPGGAARPLRVQRLWGGAAGPPPPLPAGLSDDVDGEEGVAAQADRNKNASSPAIAPPPRHTGNGDSNAFSAPNADGAFRAMGSAGASAGGAYGGASGAYAGGYGSGVSAAAAEAVTGWTPWFYREQLYAPPLAAVPPHRRPPAALRSGLGGAPLRRVLALAVLYGPVCLLLVALEARLRGAALQARCAPAWRLILARAASAGILTSCFSYVCAYAARAAPHLGIELLPRRAFWPQLGVAAAGAVAAAAWAVSMTYSAASGGLPLPMGPAAKAPPDAEQLLGLCGDPAGPEACAQAALRRVGVAWGAAVAGDAFLFTPLLMLASAYLWRDDVAVDTQGGRAGRKQAPSRGEDDASAWGRTQLELAQHASPASPPPHTPPRRAQQDDAGGGAWGDGGGGGGAWGGGGDDDNSDDDAPQQRTWHNPTYDDAAPSAPPLPPLTRAEALRAETGAWG